MGLVVRVVRVRLAEQAEPQGVQPHRVRPRLETLVLRGIQGIPLLLIRPNSPSAFRQVVLAGLAVVAAAVVATVAPPTTGGQALVALEAELVRQTVGQRVLFHQVLVRPIRVKMQRKQVPLRQGLVPTKVRYLTYSFNISVTL